MNKKSYNSWLVFLSKFTIFSTLILIFVGALVKSHEVGLSVPDWPTTYGDNMFAFPLSSMVGGILYEHGHRLIATFVGFLTLCQTLWLSISSAERWLKVVGFVSLCAVITQGMFGGLTVIFFLPPLVSIIHGTLAQTFLVILIIIAYGLSKERVERNEKINFGPSIHSRAIVLGILIYIQLILGALVRHTASGLAIPDFPTMGGGLFPIFNDAMLNHINNYLFHIDKDLVSLLQVVIHFFHRLGALIISLSFCIFFFKYYDTFKHQKNIRFNFWYVTFALLFQIALGAATVISEKHEIITSLHVLNGAFLLGLTILFILRISPVNFNEWPIINSFRRQ